jgi:hypothetical protein
MYYFIQFNSNLLIYAIEKKYAMKKIFILGLFVLSFVMIKAQAPQGIPYQAAARFANGQAIINKNIMVRFSILNASATGTVSYKETHNTSTNSLGIFNLNVGTGNPITGSFGAVDWGNSSKFLKVELDTSATGNNYIDIGTQQMMSVPYALYAGTAGSVNLNTNGLFTHYIGELFGGGIVIAVWKKNGTEHGLIASLTDISTGATYSNITYLAVGTAQNSRDGQVNTTAIVSQSGCISGAAFICNAYSSGGYSDWYLPSAWELNQCYNAATVVNEVLGDANGFQFGSYWSSNETDASYAWMQYFASGYCDVNLKGGQCRVRAVRRF